jgi:hypothetical protein
MQNRQKKAVKAENCPTLKAKQKEKDAAFS